MPTKNPKWKVSKKKARKNGAVCKYKLYHGVDSMINCVGIVLCEHLQYRVLTVKKKLRHYSDKVESGARR